MMNSRVVSTLLLMKDRLSLPGLELPRLCQRKIRSFAWTKSFSSNERCNVWDNYPKAPSQKKYVKPDGTWVTDYDTWLPKDPAPVQLPGHLFPKKKSPMDEAFDLAEALKKYQKQKEQAEQEAIEAKKAKKKPKKKAVAKKPKKIKPAKEPHIEPGDFDREI
jgi:hypothetical protein